MKNNGTQLKKGDTVAILSGKDKGKTGKVLEVSRKTNRVTVEGANILTKFQKPKQNNTGNGSRITFPAPMTASKLMLVCPNCGKATRIGHKTLENGSRQRVCKKCGTAV